MVRTQLYLDEQIHSHLRRIARQQGRTVSDLVRDALMRTYGAGRDDIKLKSLRSIAGLWRGRDDIEDTRAYVRRLRRDTHRTGRKRR